MSKTPYELRLDVLMLAKQSLTEEYYAMIDAAKLKLGNANPSAYPGYASAYPLLEMPKFPSESEVFALAESYKEFIERK